VQLELQAQAAGVKANLLAEYFSKNSTGAGLVEVALDFEAAAFTPQVAAVSSMPATSQSVIGVLADFCGIDRKIALA
jgi:predicted hotdog family 3-hydroxylacyl-ACP dehydratase